MIPDKKGNKLRHHTILDGGFGKASAHNPRIIFRLRRRFWDEGDFGWDFSVQGLNFDEVDFGADSVQLFHFNGSCICGCAPQDVNRDS